MLAASVPLLTPPRRLTRLAHPRPGSARRSPASRRPAARSALAQARRRRPLAPRRLGAPRTAGGRSAVGARRGPLGRSAPATRPAARPAPHGSSAHGRGPEATPHGGRGRAEARAGPRRSTMPEMWAAAVGAPAAAAGCSKFSPFVPRCTATDDARPSPTSKSMDQHKFHAISLSDPLAPHVAAGL